MLFQNFATKVSVIAFILLANVVFANDAHARRWVVLDSWEERSNPVVDISDPVYEYINESKTQQIVDDSGNTIEQVLNDRFRIETRTKTTKVTVYPYMKEERCRGKRCRERTRRGRPYAEETQSTDVQKLHMGTDIVSETVIKVAEVVVEEETTATEETNVAEEETTATEETNVAEEETTTVAEETTTVAEETIPTQPIATSTPNDPLDFGVNAQYLGTRTEMVSDQAGYYVNLNEYKTLNSIVNQDDALARGWTGKGSTIGILDSGIDTDHIEFADKIVYTKDLTRTSIEDNVGHGTHVTSVAAGSMNGEGMMGIAPDANIAVVKITDNWSTSMMRARQGINELKLNTDAVVANLSSNVNYSSDYKNSMTYMGDGIYTNSHSIYGGSNYYNLEKPSDWGSVMSGTEMVLTVSAGNSSDGFVQNPATFATATDVDGNLLLDGRMLVVGNWNYSTNTIDGASAGHVCKDYAGGQCNDAYKTSDFYILAPGAQITGAGIDGGYKSMSGTSQAAPVVAGAVAVVHQMWPYMKGKEISQLLLKTADKTITGYDVNTHGQGLLDLDAATRPQGDLGISFTGRTGTTVPITGGLSIAGGDSTGALSSISTVDELGRDYTVNLSSMTQTRDLIPVYQLDHSAGTAWSSKFVGGAKEYKGMHFNAYQSNWGDPMTTESFDNVTLGFDSTMFSARHPVTGAVLKPSNFTEKFTMTRSQWSPFVAFNGMFGSVQGTTSFEYSSMYKPNNWYGQVGVMYSITEFKQGMVAEVSPITSMYAVAGWDNGNFNLYGGIKPTIVNGNITLNTPSGVSADGTMNYTSHNIGLRNDPVGFVGAQFKAVDVEDKFGNSHSLKFNGVVDQNSQHRVGAYWTMEF